MLNKISNINSNVDFKKSRKYQQYRRSSVESGGNHESVHDSINITPALNFFDNSSWKMKNVAPISDEKIFIQFSIGEYDFEVMIDTTSFSGLSYLRFTVSKNTQTSLRKNRVQIDLVVETLRRLNIGNYDSLSMFDILFNRVTKMNLNGELTKSDSKIINELTDGIEAGLFKEMEAIYSVVLNFVEKYTGLRIDLKNKSQNLIQNNFSIEKIKIVNV